MKKYMLDLNNQMKPIVVLIKSIMQVKENMQLIVMDSGMGWKYKTLKIDHLHASIIICFY